MKGGYRLPWCWHRCEFDIGCDPAGGVACQEGHNLQVCSLDTRTKNKHITRDDVGRYTQGNLQAVRGSPLAAITILDYGYQMHNYP